MSSRSNPLETCIILRIDVYWCERSNPDVQLRLGQLDKEIACKSPLSFLLMNVEIIASKTACCFRPKVGTNWVDIYNLHRLFCLVTWVRGTVYKQRKKLVDLNKRFMDSQQHYYTGNSKQATFAIKGFLWVWITAWKCRVTIASDWEKC